MTHFPITALRSVNLETPDLPRSEQFYTSVWGLDLVTRHEGVTYLRASGTDHHVVALRQGDRPALRSITFRLHSDAAFETIASASLKHGATLLAGPAPNPAPDGGMVMSILAPNGGALRFVSGDMRHTDTLAGANRPTRLAHVNVNSTHVDGLAAFYEQALGFRLTDRSRMMAFVRCNGDHHAIVIADAAVNGLNHVAFLMPDLEAVMRGSGRMIDAGFPIAWGVGRHGPGDNVFAYFIDPVGTVIEYTAEVLQVDDGYAVRGPSEWVWPPGRTDHWGIAPPKPDHVKAAQTAVAYADRGPE
ncbi:VOC family protein [Tardiphaga sp.]|uniref:VOC family protein n=1 Tax=Tardiphaga sp. TaxID=1926292 RepID=UPI0026377BD8|nr:VOC family protein [Tardiphaga sp.]MDB5618169.1 glyoxalase [Tardiphaga sp.]